MFNLKNASKNLRLKKNSEYQRLFSKGKKAFSPTLIMLYFNSNETQFGMCVSKKHGTAVKRNRVKRLIREAFKAQLNKLNKNYHFVFIPKVSEEYSLKTFSKDINYMFKKAGFLNEK